VVPLVVDINGVLSTLWINHRLEKRRNLRQFAIEDSSPVLQQAKLDLAQPDSFLAVEFI